MFKRVRSFFALASRVAELELGLAGIYDALGELELDDGDLSQRIDDVQNNLENFESEVDRMIDNL